MRHLPAVLLLCLAACGTPSDEDWTAQFGDPGSAWTGPDGEYTGPTVVDQVWLDCLPEEPAWHYTVYTYGWMSDATLTVHRWYPDDLEQHHMATAERGEDGQWERRDALLPVVDEGLGVPDQSTELDCDWSFFTWRVGARDLEGVESDCVVFGYDVERLDGRGECRVLVLGG